MNPAGQVTQTTVALQHAWYAGYSDGDSRQPGDAKPGFGRASEKRVAAAPAAVLTTTATSWM
jgi:hypothetical protein